jgi:hypothetical protein
MRKSATLLVLALSLAAEAKAQPKPAMSAQLSAKVPTIKQGTLSPADLSTVQKLLSEMSPNSFKAEINQTGKAPVRLGNAAIKDLSTVSVFSGAGAKPSAANEIATSVDNYIKVIWTSSVVGADRARMDQVNALLAKGAH